MASWWRIYFDIVEDTADVRHPASRAGVLYSVVINGRITELIDIPTILTKAGVVHLSGSTATSTRTIPQNDPVESRR